jgi:hypothetical protein
MNAIRKLAGFLWIILGPAALYLLIHMAATEIRKKPVIDSIIQWSVFIGVAIPILIGLVLFGYFATKGEFDE